MRNLQKHIEKLLRKVAYKLATNEASRVDIGTDNLAAYVGPAVFESDRMYQTTPPGVVLGLAWTQLGGMHLYIEVVAVTAAEKPSLRCTGQMGDVMKESCDIAFAVARRFLRTKDPENLFLETHSLHLHIPEGATPKDGPSAGVSMVTGMLSLAMGRPVRQGLAMTGEVSLTGLVLPVGGIKEKILAAQRAGASRVLLPEANRRDWDELDEKTRGGVEVVFADEYATVYKAALSGGRKKGAGKPPKDAADHPAEEKDKEPVSDHDDVKEREKEEAQNDEPALDKIA